MRPRDIDMVIDSVLENIYWLNNLMSGAVLAVLVLLLFLGDYRPTLIIALSIPTSVVVAFVVMYFTGITLNVMSLAGLALGVGMLVDNSIVVLENIYRLHNERVPILRACVTGTTQMGGAIFSSTLTTVCVFLPLAFITGIAKELFTDRTPAGQPGGGHDRCWPLRCSGGKSRANTACLAPSCGIR